MKKFLSIALCIALICSCTALAGCGKGYSDAELNQKFDQLESELNNTKDKLDQTTNDLNDAKDKLDQTQQDLEDAQDKIEELEKDKPAKFYYGLNEPYTHYVNGEKVFEFTALRFVEGGYDAILIYTCESFKPYAVSVANFSATMFDPVQNKIFLPDNDTGTSYGFSSVVDFDYDTEKTIIIYYNGNPIFGIKSVLSKNPGIIS